MDGKKIVLWVLTILIGLMFVWSGIMKVADIGGISSTGFTQAGLPLWFMYVIGALEIIGGIGLFVPMIAIISALGLTVIMVGAVVVTLMQQPWYMAIMPFVVGILLVLIFFMRRK